MDIPKPPASHTASVMAYGFNPYLTEWSPYHGAMYAMVEAMTKIVAAGAKHKKIRFSFQEYFEQMSSPLAWGKPLAALLGALQMQIEMRLPAIGGKDSMSGTFEAISVPPTLIAFGITTVDSRRIISPEFKQAGSFIYLIRHAPAPNFLPNTDMLKQNFEFVNKQIANHNIISAYAIGFGGVAEAVCKMALGNAIGADIVFDECELFNLNYGSMLVESPAPLDFANAEEIGHTISAPSVIINGAACSTDELWQANTQKFAELYPLLPEQAATEDAEPPIPAPAQAAEVFSIKKDINTDAAPVVYLPVFAGINGEYDLERAFRSAGADSVMSVFRSITGKDIVNSIAEMKKRIAQCQILALSGGFSAADEPDGSGKFIASVLNCADIAGEIYKLLERGGLILGICNGFQALIKSGLLPYGRLGDVSEDSPTLFCNDINRHVSCMVRVRTEAAGSPWLRGFEVGQEHVVAVSHGEGKFTASPQCAQELFACGQVAFTYAKGSNINGSLYSIEGITNPSGQILGKMGHCERYQEGLFKNISGNLHQDIFGNAVRWLKEA